MPPAVVAGATRATGTTTCPTAQRPPGRRPADGRSAIPDPARSTRCAGRGATRSFNPNTASVPGARAWTGTHLDAWGIGHHEDSLLVISELVANAISHGAGPVHVHLRFRWPTLRVEVSDTGGGTVRRRRPQPMATSGRGLMLVERFADAWGVRDQGDRGKTVWAELTVVED